MHHHHNDSSENIRAISHSQTQTMQNKEGTYANIFLLVFLIMYLLVLPCWSGAAFLEEADAHLLWRYGLSPKLILQQIWELQPPASSGLQGQGMLQHHKGVLSGSANTTVGILCRRDFLLKNL